MCKNREGFTLLELIISFTILGLILTIIASAFRLGNKAWEKGEERMALLEEIQFVLLKLKDNIESMYKYKVKSEGLGEKRFIGFKGKEDSLAFVCLSSKGIKAIAFFTKEDGLYMKEEKIPEEKFFKEEEEGKEIKLSSEIKKIKFRYYVKKFAKSSEEESENYEWVDEWDLTEIKKEETERETKVEKRELPYAVEVTLILKNDEIIGPFIFKNYTKYEIPKEETAFIR